MAIADRSEGEPTGTDRERPREWVVEIAVAAAALSILCVFGVPSLRVGMERTLAIEATEYLAAVQHAQERFRVRHGGYARRLEDLDLHRPAPKSFRIGEIDVVGARDSGSWSLTLTRLAAPYGFGRYTVTFGNRGFNPGASTVDRFFDVRHVSLRPAN